MQLFPVNYLFDLYTVCKVDFVKYLGFFLDSRLSWHEHIHHVKSEVSKGIGMIKCCYNFLPRSCLLAIYYSLVYPYLSAGIEFWGCCHRIYFNELIILRKKFIHLMPVIMNIVHLWLNNLIF